jgi:CheY-like chemotaxis protein
MKRTVLVVEDDRSVRKFLRTFLESEGMEISECWTIDDALRKCAEQPFDTLILDYNLTHGEIGWRLAKMVRSNPALYGSPKIIGMSGTVKLDHVESLGFRKSDFDLFLQKPFDLTELSSAWKDPVPGTEPD